MKKNAKKILVIDDDADMIKTAQVILESKGYRTASEMEVERVLEAAKREKPDAILLDVSFPGDHTAGFEACRQLKGDQATKKIPLIMLTSINQTTKMTFDTDPDWLPADYFMEKPIKATVLLEILEKI